MIGLKITIGIITAGLFAFGGWAYTSINSITDTNSDQDIQIVSNEIKVENVEDDIREIKTDIKEILRRLE